MELFNGSDISASRLIEAEKIIIEDIKDIEDMIDKLDEISPNARDNALHALLYGYSEYNPANPPIKAIRNFVQKILSVLANTENPASEESRCLAEKLRTDRLDPDTEQVQAAAYKVVREFDRLRGLLRFKPDTEGLYSAYCVPDHFVLPLLADHFWQRFGKTSWAIIDEKRKIVLSGKNGNIPVLQLFGLSNMEHKERKKSNTDEWEGLWKNYHRSINNENRTNPQLQKQFMPRRYWKYLTEL